MDIAGLCALLRQGRYRAFAQHVAHITAQFDFDQFKCSKDSYTRYFFTNTGDDWFALISWDKNAQTPIHGHPEQFFIYLLAGELIVKNYSPNALSLLETKTYRAGEYLYHHGIKDRLDNAVHCINATTRTLSLHFYSDDPRKGVVFD